MILKIHLDGAPWYEIGDEIWQVSLEDAIRSEAELIDNYAVDQLPKLDRRASGMGLSIGS